MKKLSHNILHSHPSPPKRIRTLATFIIACKHTHIFPGVVYLRRMTSGNRSVFTGYQSDSSILLTTTKKHETRTTGLTLRNNWTTKNNISFLGRVARQQHFDGPTYELLGDNLTSARPAIGTQPESVFTHTIVASWCVHTGLLAMMEALWKLTFIFVCNVHRKNHVFMLIKESSLSFDSWELYASTTFEWETEWNLEYFAFIYLHKWADQLRFCIPCGIHSNNFLRCLGKVVCTCDFQ